MKKLVSTICALSFIGTASFAQTWTPINSSSFYTPATSVGIGTSMPPASAYLSFPAQGTFLSIGDNVSWAQKKILSAGYSASLLDYLDIQVPGSPTNYALIRLIRNGNVGIYTGNPTERLTVDGNIELSSTTTFSPSRYVKLDRLAMQRLSSASANWTRAIMGQGAIWNDAASKWQIGLGFESQWTDFALTRYENGGVMSFYTGGSMQSSPYQLSDQDFQAYKRMTIDADGKVIIGNVTTPNGYKLYVKDGILTEKIKVAIANDPTNWSDFVFADDYALKPLNEVEDYIAEHKHLPEIPSTKEVIAEGVDLAKMDAKLLQKIEELTLYMIQLQKDNAALKSRVGELEKNNSTKN